MCPTCYFTNLMKRITKKIHLQKVCNKTSLLKISNNHLRIIFSEGIDWMNRFFVIKQAKNRKTRMVKIFDSI